MRRESEELLELVRAAQEPTPADEARVLSALKATLAAGATSNAIVSATLARTGRARSGATAGALGSKLSVVVACAAAAVFGSGDTSSRGGTSRVQPAIDAADHALQRAPETSAPRAARATPALEAAPSPPVAPTIVEPQASRAARAKRPGASPLRAELELLQRVQRSLREGDGEAALRELDGHVTRDRILSAERAAARILALCSVGRVAEARSAAARFAQEHPESVQRDVIARSCANL